MSTSRALDALGDPTRRRILAVLAGSEHAAGTVVEKVQEVQAISQPAVSQHLKMLREAGLVRVRAEGARRLYSIDAEGLDAVHDWLHGLAHPAGVFDQPLDALATEVARGQRARRTQPPSRASRSA